MAVQRYGAAPTADGDRRGGSARRPRSWLGSVPATGRRSRPVEVAHGRSIQSQPKRYDRCRGNELAGCPLPITIVSYAYVEPGGVPPTMTKRATTAEVRSYLSEHVDALQAKAGRGSLAPAVLRTTDATTRFDRLKSGTEKQFIEASQAIASSLFTRMDKRSKRGFFVTIRRSNPTVGAALKLDVNDAAAAALRVKSGTPTLEAVTDLLDIPGELQKGAVYPDSRSESDIVVGDKLAVTSLYFLEALDLEQHASPGPATADLMRVIQEVAPSKVAATAAALEGESRLTVDDFLERHEDLLDEDERTEVRQRSEARRRPIDIVDPASYALREEIEADGITVRGRTSAIAEKVTIQQRPGGYRIQIDVQEEPRRRYL
jgi:hypothetical protein